MVPRIASFALEQVLKTIRRPSRVFSVAAALLLRRDRPAAAWHCLRPLLKFGRPSIEQYLLAANCLYQGLGRYRDAMALLTRANESAIGEAARLGPADNRIRVLDRVWVRHIGHIALVDYAVKLGMIEGRRGEDTILYAPPGTPIANRFLLDQAAVQLRLIENPAELPFPEAALQALHFDILAPRLPDQTIAHYWQLAAETYARWERDGRGPLFALSPDVQARGWKALQELGISEGGWFVALHVREREPDGHASGINAVRNAEVSAYFPAIGEITSRGGWVIRIGDPSMGRLPMLPNVIDYCHSTLRADWMDIFILASCRFMIGTNSGPAFVPALYGTPAVLTNWWPAAERPWHSSDIFVPKLLRRISDGSYLTFGETLCEPLGWCYSQRYLADRAGVRLEDNDPEIIRAAAKEMLDRLEHNSRLTEKVALLRAHADRIYRGRGLGGGAQLASQFLLRHETLLSCSRQAQQKREAIRAEGDSPAAPA